MKKILALLLCLLMVLSFAACSSNTEINESETETKVMTIKEAIDSVDGLSYINNGEPEPYRIKYFETIEDDYASLEINTNGGGWNDDTISKLNELNKNLGFSGALVEKFEGTSRKDGKQTEENENYKVTWSYDNPYFRVIYEMK